MQTKDKLFLTAQDVSELLEISKGHSYKIIRELNTELREKGFIVISGKIPTDYLKKRCYCIEN